MSSLTKLPISPQCIPLEEMSSLTKLPISPQCIPLEEMSSLTKLPISPQCIPLEEMSSLTKLPISPQCIPLEEMSSLTKLPISPQCIPLEEMSSLTVHSLGRDEQTLELTAACPQPAHQHDSRRPDQAATIRREPRGPSPALLRARLWDGRSAPDSSAGPGPACKVCQAEYRGHLQQVEGHVFSGPSRSSWRILTADDINRLSQKQQDAHEKLYHVAEGAEKTGLQINIRKTEAMRMNIKQANALRLHDENIEEVDKFVYLGSVSKDGGTDEDIRCRINKAR
ncbi:hypothetical protein EGW08_022622 [Elysia chlorotica]|uniref:Reverse transcriptase domain-containing protein n=1 Tax=Elysia chlorotica TaxID=188477 RepID=A0A3S0Z568_ELYCH|nr:hypothetical protein EGW08_022622 [Elysia chlorotica]